MADPYTHEFKFETDGQYLRGEIEYNTDEKTTYRVNEMSHTMYGDLLDLFKEFIMLSEKIFRTVGELKVIRIKKKE